MYDRDGGCCIFCGKPGDPWCHYIGRAQGGLGIEQNVLTMCAEHHRAFDQGAQAQRMVLKSIARDYLKARYPGWNENNLIYRKE